MKYKYVDAKVKAGSDDLAEGEFTAYVSTWTRTPDSYGDVVREGAFTKTLADWEASKNTIPILYGHRLEDPDYNIGGVIEAAQDAHGFFIRGRLDLDNPKSAQTYRLMKGGRVGQMSFAYDVLDGDVITLDDGSKAYEIREVKLYEVSVVPIGANQDTEILAVKAFADSLDADMKAGRVLAQKHIDSLRAAQDAIGAVIAAAEGTDQAPKASGHAEAKPEEPRGVKGEEQPFNPSAVGLALETQLLALTR